MICSTNSRSRIDDKGDSEILFRESRCFKISHDCSSVEFGSKWTPVHRVIYCNGKKKIDVGGGRFSSVNNLQNRVHILRTESRTFHRARLSLVCFECIRINFSNKGKEKKMERQMTIARKKGKQSVKIFFFSFLPHFEKETRVYYRWTQPSRSTTMIRRNNSNAPMCHMLCQNTYHHLM
jgi:hypothetical protein